MKNIIHKFLFDSKNFLPVIVIYGIAKMLQLLVAIAIARVMLKDEAGSAFYLIGLVSFNSAIASLGLDNFSSYALPRFKRSNFVTKTQSYILFSVTLSLPVAILLSLPIFLENGSRSFVDNIALIITAALCTSASIYRRVLRTVFLGFSKRIKSIIHESAVSSLTMIILLLVFKSGSLIQFAIILSLSHIIAAVAAWVDVQKFLPSNSNFSFLLPNWRVGRIMLLLAAPSLISQASSQLLNRADVLILAPLSSPEQVSVYSVAIRVTFFMQAIIELTNFIYGSRILASGNKSREQQQILARTLLLQTGALATLVSVPLMIFSKEVLSILFGNGYSSASTVLQVIVAGKLLTAPFGPILTMFVVLGNNKILARIIFTAAVANIIVDILLIPSLGALGAAIGCFIALAIMSVGYTMLYLRVFGRNKSKIV